MWQQSLVDATTCKAVQLGAARYSERVKCTPQIDHQHEPQRLFLSLREVAEQLGVSYDTVRRLLARYELPVVKLGKRSLRIPVAALDVYIHRRYQ